MRKMLSPVFSQQSLAEQEPVMSKRIDNFVEIVGKKAPSDSEAIDMTKWYSLSIYDTLTEMTFGESFHSMEIGKINLLLS